MLKKSFFIALFIFTTLQAQTLTLKECIEKATTSHPDIKTFMLHIQKSAKGTKVANADYLPQITASAEYDFQKTYALPQNGVFHTIDDDGWQVGVTLQQKIWDFSKTTSKIAASKIEEDIAKLSLKDAKALMAFNVKLQYELMLVQQQAIVVREKDLQAKTELYKQANEQVRLGMKTKADASRFLSAVYMAKDNLAIAQADFSKAKTRLSNYIGQNIAEDILLEDTIANNSLQITGNLLQEVMHNNLQLQSLQKSIQINTLNKKSAKASHYGSIDAIASYNKIGSLNEYDSSLIGITLKIPLYSGGRTSATVEQAAIQEQSTKEVLNSKKLALKNELEALLIDLQRYEKTLQAKQAQLEASQETKVLLEARYKEGLSTYIEVLDAISLYLDAKLGLLQAQYAKSSTINRINYLEGKTL